MATPKDNTEVIRMLRDVKNSIWKSITPMKAVDHNFKEYISSLSNTIGETSRLGQPKIATKLNFSGMDDTHVGSDSASFHAFKTPDSLKRKLINTEIELQASIAKLKERESFISVIEPANKKVCVRLENKLEKYRKQTELDSQKMEELEGKLRWVNKQLSCAKAEMHSIERKKKIDLDQKELKFVALQQEYGNLKLEVANVKSEKSEAIRKLNVEKGRLEMKVRMLDEEVEKSQEYIQSLKRQNSEMAEKVALCNSYQEELKEAQSKIKILENKIEADKDASLIIASRQNDLKTLNEMEKENRILKEEVAKYKESNVMLYQEKMWSMQEKLAQAEKKCVSLTKLQVENEQLKGKISQWEALFDDKSSPYKSPTAFSRKLSQYQQQEAILTNKLSQLTSRLENAEKLLLEKEDKIKLLNRHLDQSQMKQAQQESHMKRFKQKMIFLTKEKDNCRKLLDSYLSEATISGVVLNAAQINHLEELNAEYKRALDKSEREIDSLNEKMRSFITKENSENTSNSENVKLRNEVSSLLSTIDELKKDLELQKASQLEKVPAAPSGEHRVLHLRFNPLESAWRQQQELFGRLQEENDRLKKRVRVLEEEGAAAADVTMKVQRKLEVEGSDSTLQSLQEQLAAANKKIGYIIENARIKSTEFREAIYRLTGYRVDLPMAETYKLSHLYADSRDDFLLFKVNSEGIQLMESDYSHQQHDRVQTYLHQFDSFPAFLASLTMELFNQQTFMLESS